MNYLVDDELSAELKLFFCDIRLRFEFGSLIPSRIGIRLSSGMSLSFLVGLVAYMKRQSWACFIISNKKILVVLPTKTKKLDH